MKTAVLGALTAASLLVARGVAAPPEQVTVEFLSRRSEGLLEAQESLRSRRYTLELGGDIVAERRILSMSDASLGADLAYTGSRPCTRYVFLFVYTPDETGFSTVTKAVERLKTIIAKSVTGNCKVVIEVLPRDWFFVTESDEPDEAERGQTRDGTELQPSDTPETAADEGSNHTPEPAAADDSDADAPKLWNRPRQLPAPSLQVAVAALRATRKDASMKDALRLWTVMASWFLADRSSAAPPERVTVTLLSDRAESGFKPERGHWPLRYLLTPTGDIERTRQFGSLSDASLGRDLAYKGPGLRTQYVFLYVDRPDQTKFSDVAKAVERLKTVIAKNMTGNGKVVIEVMRRDWVLVYEPDIADSSEPASAGSVAEGDVTPPSEVNAEPEMP